MAMQREHDALHDVLTGLPNRALLNLSLESALADLEVGRQDVIVMMIDLDHFKEINDTLGHHVGDSLIVEVGQRLHRTAGDRALVARLGGDEFAILLRAPRQDALSQQVAIELAHDLAQSLDHPVTLAGVRIEIRASLGIALAPMHADTAAELLTRADVAMYAAKQNRTGFAVYDPKDDEHTPQRLALLAELRDGIERGELLLHYQPKCEARSRVVVGAEALVRWRHPTLGLLMPFEFIPLAENTGLITPLTLAVLDEAVRQGQLWRMEGHDLTVAVNLSMRHLTDLQLPAHVAATLARHRYPPERLTLEVTESTIMNDPSRAVSVLAHLRAIGVRVAVDDYGTGYSSLAYLKQLDVDELKIDRSFITGISEDPNDEIIVRSTIELGHSLGLHIVAEGVEDLATWDKLLPLGCDVIQGYFVGRPIRGDQFTQWMREWNERWKPLDADSQVPTPRTECPDGAQQGTMTWGESPC